MREGFYGGAVQQHRGFVALQGLPRPGGQSAVDALARIAEVGPKRQLAIIRRGDPLSAPIIDPHGLIRRMSAGQDGHGGLWSNRDDIGMSARGQF